MSYIEKTNWANPNNYGGKRTLNKESLDFIVIHYTANDGDHDESNGNYFHNNKVGASAHDFVDSDSVTHSVPYDNIAYAVGKDYRTDDNGGKFYGKCTNKNSISIELCDDVKNGKIYPSQATINNAIELTKKLMKKYGIPQSHVIRHYDVNGKHCPAYWLDDSKWKSEFWNKLSEAAKPSPKKSVYPYTLPLLPPNLKKGSKGTNVKRLQKFLNWYGNYGLSVDGQFGTNTYNAVRKYQKSERLTVDGIFGLKSLSKAKTVKR